MNFSLIVFITILTITRAQISGNSIKLLQRVYNQCLEKDEIFKCWKIQTLKAIDRALYRKSLNLTHGISIVVNNDRIARNLPILLNETKLEKLETRQIDNLLIDRTARFIDNHKIQIKIPELIEEGRKKDKGGNYGALLGALAIKGTFLAMAYQGIAVMSGTALIVGKMALLLAAILGLKKLVSGKEKTTFEIVKVPKHYEEHTHSSSYENEGYHHHRALDVDGSKTSPYRGYSPRI